MGRETAHVHVLFVCSIRSNPFIHTIFYRDKERNPLIPLRVSWFAFRQCLVFTLYILPPGCWLLVADELRNGQN
jgi:hypothetical protein